MSTFQSSSARTDPVPDVTNQIWLDRSSFQCVDSTLQVPVCSDHLRFESAMGDVNQPGDDEVLSDGPNIPGNRPPKTADPEVYGSLVEHPRSSVN